MDFDIKEAKKTASVGIADCKVLLASKMAEPHGTADYLFKACKQLEKAVELIESEKPMWIVKESPAHFQIFGAGRKPITLQADNVFHRQDGMLGMLLLAKTIGIFFPKEVLPKVSDGPVQMFMRIEK